MLRELARWKRALRAHLVTQTAGLPYRRLPACEGLLSAGSSGTCQPLPTGGLRHFHVEITLAHVESGMDNEIKFGNLPDTVAVFKRRTCTMV